MEIMIRTHNNITVAALSGDIDSNTASHVKDTLAPHIEHGERILLDMTGVKFMSSFGLRSLLLMKREADSSHGDIFLAGLADPVENVMDVTGFLSFFEVFETVESGLETLDQR